MTNDQLTAMAALAEKASDPPWARVGERCLCVNPKAPHDEHRGLVGSRPDDLEFIAAARTFVPEAIVEIKRLRGLVEAAYREGCLDNPLSEQFVEGDWHRSDAKRALEGGADV